MRWKRANRMAIDLSNWVYMSVKHSLMPMW
jgi:hypothetical protein